MLKQLIFKAYSDIILTPFYSSCHKYFPISSGVASVKAENPSWSPFS
jgi:hypothetical protein